MKKNRRIKIVRMIAELFLVVTVIVSMTSCRKNEEPAAPDNNNPQVTSEPATTNEPTETEETEPEETILEDEGDLEIIVPEDEETFGE